MKFSIRDLLWLTLVVSLVLGMFAQRRQFALDRREDAKVQWRREYKLKVEHDEELKKTIKEQQGYANENIRTLHQFLLDKAKAREVEFKKELEKAKTGQISN